MRHRARIAAFAVFLLLSDVAQAAAAPGDARPAATQAPAASTFALASVPAGPPPLAALTWREGSAASYASSGYDPRDSSRVTLPPGSTVLREAAISGAAIGAGFLLDDTIEPGSGEGTFLDNAAQAVGSPPVLIGGTILLALYGLGTHAPHEVTTAKKIALALAATSITVVSLKAATKRERPDESNDDSFPSGHTANTMAVATVLDREYDGVVPWIGYGTAALVGAGRIVGNHHWFSDVMAGAVIGRFFGRLFTGGSASASPPVPAR